MVDGLLATIQGSELWSDQVQAASTFEEVWPGCYRKVWGNLKIMKVDVPDYACVTAGNA